MTRRARQAARAALMPVAMLFLATVAGCATAAPSPASKLIDASEVPAAWEEALNDVPGDLPDGIIWPADPPDYLLEEGSLTDKDVPAMLLSDYWLCAWEVDYLSALSTEQSADAELALDAVKLYAELPYVKRNFIDLQSWYSTVVQKAIDGDPTGIENEVLDCQPNLEMSSIK